jgi:hypothetical protein
MLWKLLNLQKNPFLFVTKESLFDYDYRTMFSVEADIKITLKVLQYIYQSPEILLI